MTMRKIIFGVCLIVLVAGNIWSRGIDAPSSLVVLPARQRVVEFGFDLIYREGVTLISYQQVGSDLLVHLWNGREWVPMAPAAYFSGTFLLGAPEMVVLVGDDNLLPTMFQTAPDWCRKTVRVRALDISTLVNQCGALFDFNDQDWKWFAGKYGLSLTDSNASRRRWGKYGPPGQEWYRQQPPPKGELRPVVLPSAVEPVQAPTPPANVIPDNAPAAPVAPVVTTPAPAPVTPAPVVPAPPVAAQVVAAPALPTPPAAIAPAVPADPVAPAVTTPAVLPPGTTTEVSGK